MSLETCFISLGCYFNLTWRKIKIPQGKQTAFLTSFTIFMVNLLFVLANNKENNNMYEDILKVIQGH